MQRRHIDSQQTYEQMLNISNYQKNAKKKQKPIEGGTWYQQEWPSSKNMQIINAGEDIEKRESSYTVGGNVNWYSHYGEQHGGSLKS